MTVIGSLLWLAACTRPDLSFTVSVLARYLSNPGPAHYTAMLRALAYLKRTKHVVLRLTPSMQNQDALEIYSDASWTTGASVSGGVALYMGCPISWWTRKQKSVSSSSAEAEYFAASLSSREGVYMRDLLEDMGLGVMGPTPLYLDSKSAIELSQDPVAFKKTKHILRAANELRDRVAKDIFRTEFVEGVNQLADLLTKALGPTAHRMQIARVLHVAEPADDE